MYTPEDILGHLHNCRILDVATGTGGFIHFLLDGLPDYAEIIGIDTNPRGEAAFETAFKEKPGIRFQSMDALQMTFEPASFDLVCISNSLHHFDDPLPVLREMVCLLRLTGHFLINEMYRDNQTETQLTHVALHHWWAEVDRISGIVHNQTYSRDELVKLFESLNLSDVRQYDLVDTTYDPHSPEILDELNPAIDRYIQRAESHPEIQARGEQLRQRVQEIGFHSATSLLLLGKKHD